MKLRPKYCMYVVAQFNYDIDEMIKSSNCYTQETVGKYSGL